MKEVHYGKDVFLLTDEEYEKALPIWSEKKNFACARLDNAVLGPNFTFTRTPPDDQSYEVFVIPGKHPRKVFKQGNKYFMNFLIDEDVRSRSEVTLKPEELAILVPQDEFFKKIKITSYAR